MQYWLHGNNFSVLQQTKKELSSLSTCVRFVNILFCHHVYIYMRIDTVLRYLWMTIKNLLFFFADGFVNASSEEIAFNIPKTSKTSIRFAFI